MILLSIFRRKILFSRCFLFSNVNYSKIVITYVPCTTFLLREINSKSIFNEKKRILSDFKIYEILRIYGFFQRK